MGFTYQDPFPLEKDSTEYRLLTGKYISSTRFNGHEILHVAPEALTLLCETAFRDASHLLRSSHLEQLARIIKDPEASSNERYVAQEMIRNAIISSEMIFPLCQDTGTAVIIAKK